MFEEIANYDYCSFVDEKLTIYDKTVKDLIKGKNTPCFIFLQKRFEDNFKHMNKSLNKFLPKISIAYAVKANYLGRILSLVKEIGMGVEVMSLFEFKLVEEAEIPYEKIIFNGPAKTREELQVAIKNKLLFLNVDSLNELKEIEEIAKTENTTQSVLIRIHPNLKQETENKLLIRKNSKLGIDYLRAIKLFKYAKKSVNLNPVGVHVHIGTNLYSHEFYEELLGFLNNYIKRLEKENSININYVNLGGGLASRSILKERNFSFEKLGKQIANKIDKIEERTIIFEPGRYLIEDSFIAVAKVLRTKKTWGRKWAYVDIGANSLIPLRYSNYRVLPAINKGEGQYCNIGGPLCLPVDVISNEAINFEIGEEDLVVILNCGAYTMSMSEQFGYPRPDIYELLQNGNLNLIKERETIEKMVKDSFFET